jgi:hypothetical protein
VEQVQLVDYKIYNYAVFPEFTLYQYNEWRGEEGKTHKIFWALFKYEIMTLLYVAFFVNSHVVQKRARLLLLKVYLGGIWMDRKVPINYEVIQAIKKFRSEGPDATYAFTVQ